MKRFLLAVLFCCLVSIPAQGGLNTPVLVNPSFEDPALAAGASTGGVNGWWDSVAYTYTQDDGAASHPATPYGDNWVDFAQERWIYQQIGTYEEGLTLAVPFLLGCRTDKAGLTLRVNLLAGGNPALAADTNKKYWSDNPLETVVGATLIDTWTVPSLASGEMAETTAYLSTGTGFSTGEPLWLQFVVTEANSGRVLIDNIDVTVWTDPVPPPFDAATALDMYNNPGNYTSSNITAMVNTILNDSTVYGYSQWNAAWDILAPVITNNTPTPETPLITSSTPGSEQLAAAMILWESKALRSLDLDRLFAHRAALPVDAAAPRVSRNRTINIDAGWHKQLLIDTGLYAAPGETVTITVPGELAGVDVTVEVGHGVDGNGLYNDNDKYHTMPYPSRTFALNSTTLTVGNVHGGLIMFNVPSAVAAISNAVVTIDGAVEVPHFILGETTDAEWIGGIRDRGTPWGVIESDRCKAIYRSDHLQALDNPTAVAQMWEDMTFYEEDFYGPTPTRPYRQHADYHGIRGFSTFPQYKDPNGGAPVNLTGLQINGDAMVFHEYGHILDLGQVWKWNGFTESVNNWAGVYMAHNFFEFTYKDNVTPIRRARNYELEVSPAADFMASGDRAYLRGKMALLGMMGDHFGWQNCRDIIHYIQSLPATDYDTNQKRMDLWLTEVGNRFGYDVSPLLERWHWTFSSTAKSAVSGLPKFCAIEQTQLSMVVKVDTPSTLEALESLGYSYDGTNGLSSVGTPSHGSLVDNGDGSYTYTPDAGYTGSDAISYTLTNSFGNAFVDTINIMVVDAANFPTIESGAAMAGTAGWTTVQLNHSYNSMVVVAQPVLESGQVPLVSRIRNAAGSSFEVMLQRADGLAGDVSGIQVEYMVVEEGVYGPETTGIRMEAVKVLSSVTDSDSSWTGETYAYAFGSGTNHYRAPALLGQVMSYNDPDWSTFWSAKNTNNLGDKIEPGTGFVCGKHVGEDPDTTRADETIGYLIVDSGLTPQYQIGNCRFQVGGTMVDFDKNYKLSETSQAFTFNMMPSVRGGLIQASGLEGTITAEQGYWTVLDGPDPFLGGTASARTVEDGYGSTTQSHQDENGSYIVFAGDTTTQNGLFNPALVNGDFEDPALAVGASTGGVNGWWDSVAYTFTADDGAASHPDTPYGDNWSEFAQGRWMYQMIGTYKENMDLQVSFLLGRRTDNVGLGTTVSLLVGGNPGLAADTNVKYGSNPLTGTVGATLISSSPTIPALSTSGATSEESLTLSTGTGYTEGDPLWLQFNIAPDGGGRVLIDHVQVEELLTNSDPVFTVDPITGNGATEDAAYAGTLAGSATDADAGDTLTYSKVSGPAWLAVASDGTLSGMPSNADVGANAFTVQVDDGNGGTDTATLNITVANINDAPVFTADPITGSAATEDAAYAGTLAGSATDVDAGDTLTYSKVSGPAWLAVASDGTLSGTPSNADVGANAFTVQVSDGNGGLDTATLDISVASGQVADFAQSEATVLGLVSSGSIADTVSNDNAYEVLTEGQSGGNPNSRQSYLEHTWTFNVSGGELVTFYVEAHHDANSEGDDFQFAYSTDNVNFTDMVLVTKTADDNTAQFYVLPGGTVGTVYIRVTDADRTPGNSGLDSLYVDALFIVSESASTVPMAANDPFPADGATSVPLDAVLGWTPGALAASHDVYFGTGPTPAFQGNQAGDSFDPGTLNASTTYYWAIDEVNSVGTTAGAIWSFTTGSATPSMYVSAIDLDTQKSGKDYKGVVLVTVLESGTDLPVQGATVSGSFTGIFSESGSATTDASGIAVITTSAKASLPFSYTFTVTDVTESGHIYDPAANVESSDSGSF